MNKIISRRDWLKQSGVGFSGVFLQGLLGNTDIFKKKDLTILLVSGWQDINIGDIAHTPGLLHVLETFLPEARIILWKRSYSKEVEELLIMNFPDVKIVNGNVTTSGEVDSEDVRDAFSRADLMIHGSGPSIVGKTNLEAWYKSTGKPFGIFGTTIQDIDKSLAELLKKALFIYTRETASLKMLEASGIKGDKIFFVPDATFYLNLKNETKAISFLKENGLVEKKFICVIPRLRKTPYYKIRPESYSPAQVKAIDDLNNSKKGEDHTRMREAMISWIRTTGNKVLICPEMTYQVEIMDELLINPLPADVKPFVLKRGYWFPDEAASVYERASAVLSFECHSPIIAIRNNTPAIYLRQPEDTIKGQMYYDMGLKDWVFEIEQSTGKMIAERLTEIISGPRATTILLKNVNKSITAYYKKAVKVLKDSMS